MSVFQPAYGTDDRHDIFAADIFSRVGEMETTGRFSALSITHSTGAESKADKAGAAGDIHFCR